MSSGKSAAGAGPRGFRTDIQWLRALAVGAVVLYHFWPGRLTGGFVGVDVFFVISGYLITAHLVSEFAGTGRVAVFAFWARRIRRLLPASLLVLLLSVIAVVVWIPPSLQGQSLREIVASTLYVQNWQLAADSVDYLAASNVPTLAQHYWSLSVEEQFYIVWPLLLLVAGAIAIRTGKVTRFGGLAGAVLIAVASASLVWSIVQTGTDPSFAYFSTATRAWEFAAGGVLAAVPSLARGPGGRLSSARMRWVTRAVGLAAILVAAARYTSAMPFPGWIALLPVLGAALLIWAGIGAPQVVTRRRDPITLIGDRSYSIYLLHWPAIIVAPYVLGHELGAAEKIMLLALVLVLAALSTDWVEDPVRRSAWLIARSWRTFVAMALAMALVIGAAVGAQYAIAQNRPAPEVVLGPGTCIAYDALVNPSCKKPFSPDEVDTGFAVTDESMACPWGTADAAFKICEFGAVEDYTHTLAYVGDSHASALLPGVIDSLPAGWRLLAYVTGGCASISREAYGAPGLHSVQKREQCKARTNTFLDLIEADSSVDAVMFTNYTRVYAAPPADGLKSLTAELIDATWRDLEDLGKSVIAVQDAPFLDVGSIPQCIDAAGDTYDPCTAPRSDAVLENDPMKAAVDLNDARTWIDISGSVCDDTTCHAVIGKTAAYFDADHISMRYSKSLPQFLRPLIGAALERVETAEAAAAG